METFRPSRDVAEGEEDEDDVGDWVLGSSNGWVQPKEDNVAVAMTQIGRPEERQQ